MNELRIAVVSCLAHDPLTPRGLRTRTVAAALADRGVVELVAPAARVVAREAKWSRARRSRARRIAGRGVNSILADRHELVSRRFLKGWLPSVDGALLIGYPFTTIAIAAARLASTSTPYIVDIGDPWALTARHPVISGIGLWRAQLMERRLWDGAAGAIVTTPYQAAALRDLYPCLRILVRPNGVDAGQPSLPKIRASGEDDAVLRLAHFGTFYSARIDVVGFLKALGACGLWRSVEFHQFGAIWDDRLLAEMPNVSVVPREPVPWEMAIGLAGTFDAAVAIGNRDPAQLPSKAIAYLALPIPRVAVVSNAIDDALRGYVASKPGWLIVEGGAELDAVSLRAHVGHRWTDKELALPASETWPAVASGIARFVWEVIDRERLVNDEGEPACAVYAGS